MTNETEANDVESQTMSKLGVHRIVTRIFNDEGQTYFVVVATANPGKFVRELWESMSDRHHGCPATDEEACQEWTDRIRDYRTTVNHEGACIRTHAWHPSGDKRELHHDVLEYLRGQGLSV